MSDIWEVEQYAKLIDRILKKGQKRKTRNQETYSIFGEMLTIDLQEAGFPILQGRKMYYKPVIGEFAAMIHGPKYVQDFQQFGCNYWNDWGNKDPAVGTLGAINVDYGNAWINWNGVNQVERVIETIKKNPADRRLIVSGWRPDQLEHLSLPCCHLLYQWYVRDEQFLDMVWYQRSVDTMVGLPSDIILCALWNSLLAHETNLKPGVIKLVLGDTHIYNNHLEPALDYLRQLQDTNFNYKTTYELHPVTTLLGFEPEMITINGYVSQPPIKFELNV